AEVTLDPSTPLVLELRCGTGNVDAAPIPEPLRSEQTQQHWKQWASGLTLPTVATEACRRSALVLKGLCHGPTGGIAAAATTSLPEHCGGIRNWDYRYCWVRDGAMTAEALATLGSLTEGMQFLDWALGVIDRTGSPDQLRPVYTLAGEELGTEAEIAELTGYAGSRPVRVGNAASRQVQLDVFGPLIQLIDVLVERGAPLSSEHWRLVSSLVDTVSRRWREPDHGIWEVRGPRRHFVHSKVMCWAAVDRGIRIASRLAGETREDWIALRDEIAEDVVTHGWKPEVHSFVAAYDGTDLDASTLFVGLTGLLPADDPRFRDTVDTVDRYLRDGPTVYRYRFEDGLPGTEGGFHICTTWLIRSLLLIGETRRARELFDAFSALGGPTGLFPEEWDEREQRSLGNHPQAYTHLGLIECAWAFAALEGNGQTTTNSVQDVV
ncbi:MAG: glycoside hydrolase family 15 protein, partial [Planctomycetota bacterium]